MVRIKTTLIGSYPKPNYLNCPDWFKDDGSMCKCKADLYSKYMLETDPITYKTNILKATKEILDKCSIIDIITDGEIRRENYIHYHCRHLDGISFDILTKKIIRNGAYEDLLPTIIGKIKPKDHFLSTEWLEAKKLTKNELKITLPGPMTVFDTIANNYYDNEDDALTDIAIALNYEILDLVKNGCKYIQIDEPLFARKPETTLRIGIKLMDKCFENVNKNVVKIIHMCCGYPDKVGETNYMKADQNIYIKIAHALDSSPSIDQISLEDAHRHNNDELFKLIKNKTIIIGVVKIASLEVEPVNNIKNRLLHILQYIPSERLLVAPDCGLAMLPDEICLKKLQNMKKAVDEINEQINIDIVLPK